MNDFKRILGYIIGYMIILLPFNIDNYQIKGWQYILIIIGGAILAMIGQSFPPEDNRYT